MAKKQKAQAMVHYNQNEDAYELYIRSNEHEEWGFSCSAKCRAIEGETETNFIHFSFLKELLDCIAWDYQVFEGDPHKGGESA